MSRSKGRGRKAGGIERRLKRKINERWKAKKAAEQVKKVVRYVADKAAGTVITRVAGVTIAAILAHGHMAPAPWNVHPPAHTSPTPKKSVERLSPLIDDARRKREASPE
ncbi:hypothetical protein [Paraburkholderia sp. J8-2]|uniref:hypothetical protein n=1 Tax=Paraburkholderia sp. J8-2 TaxID=2805440 RepID=UPI002AB75984|nr:hypothetical protein [Paraburkholderia sp. J8-2]